MRWNMPLWYLPMLFALLQLAWVVFDDPKSTQRYWLILVISIMIAYCGYELVKLPNLPLGLETMIYLFPFFVEGKVIGRYLVLLDGQTKKSRILVGIVLVLTATIMSVGEGQISYNADNYGKRGYLYFIIMCSAFCIGFVCMFSTFGSKIGYLKYLGKNTVGVMVMHKFPILFFIGILPISKVLINTSPLAGAFVIAILSIVMCLIASEIIYRIFPYILGKKRIHDSNK